MKLVLPNAAHEAAFLAFAEEYRQAEPERWRRRYRVAPGGFGGYLAELQANALPRLAWTRPRTPEQTFWLLDDEGRIVGASRLRSELLPEEAWFDGHMGLDVAVSRRGEGLGAELLRRTCERAWRRGYVEVIVTAPEANAASCRTAARCGAALLEVVPDRDGEPLCRYRLVRSKEAKVPLASP